MKFKINKVEYIIKEVSQDYLQNKKVEENDEEWNKATGNKKLPKVAPKKK